MIIQDFSNWDQSLFEYGKTLVSYKGILEFEMNDIVSLSSDYEQRQKEIFTNIVEGHLYWIGLGVGIENIIKAVLIKHKTLLITRRNDFDNKLSALQSHFNSYQNLETYRQNNLLNKYQNVFQHVNSITLQADNNLWLAQQFINAGIQHSFEINTPTLYRLYSQEIPKLLTLNIITPQEKDEIFDSLEVFRLMRRNVDSHIYLKSRVVGSINRDVEDIYIPVINLLTDIYHRS